MEFCTRCCRHQDSNSPSRFLDCAGRAATLCQHLCCGQNFPRDRKPVLCTGVPVVVYQSDLLLSHSKAKQSRKWSLFQISQMWWIHIFQYWGGRGRTPDYWECLRKEREKGLAFIYSKSRHKKISVLREISNPHSKSIWSIPVIHGEYKMVPKFHVEKAKIRQIYLDAGGINKC